MGLLVVFVVVAAVVVAGSVGIAVVVVLIGDGVGVDGGDGAEVVVCDSKQLWYCCCWLWW